MVQQLVRALALAVGGGALSFLGLTVYLGIVGEVLRAAYIPPANWFGTDYVDPRGAAVSFSGELVFLGLLYFAGGRLSGRCTPRLTRLEAFWLCNPLSTAIGALASRSLMSDIAEGEFATGALILALVGWPILWHLAVLGSRRAEWVRATAIVCAYSLALCVLAIVQSNRVFWFS